MCVLGLMLMLGLVAPAAATVAAQATPDEGKADATIVLGAQTDVQGDGVSVDGSFVTITAGGTYLLSGDLADGMVQVQAPDEIVTLVLDGVNIANSSGPAILIAAADEAIVTLADGSENFLADGGASEEDAALYSLASLTINGTGSLAVQGNANEGISSTMDITIESGDIRVQAFEDGINASTDGVSQINISGGYLFVETETGDAIDSNGTITITGGTVIALGALVDMNGGIDADGAVTIDGGTVIATGARNSSPVTDAAQKSLLVSFGGTQPAGTLIVIQDEAGNAVLTFAPPVDFQQVLVSTGDIADGVTYTVFAGGTASGDPVDGVYTEAPTDLGTDVGTVTTDSVNQGGPGRR